MNNRTCKSTWWLILAIGLINQFTLHAQTSISLPETGTSGSVDFELRLDGSIIEEGSGTSTLSNSDIESSSRFIWNPTLYALRAGGGLSTETVSNIGSYSVALGDQCTASGYAATAIGYDCSAGNFGATALGYSTASSAESTAMGYSTAGASLATAMGNSTASGSCSTAMGNATASGAYATAVGQASTNSYDSLVIGAYNLDLSESGASTNPTAWNNTLGSADPLFEVGNGISTAKSDALVVYKDGNAVVQGTTTSGGGFITTAASVATTDIPMYQP